MVDRQKSGGLHPETTITNSDTLPTDRVDDGKTAFAAGEVVAQRYRIVALLGRGGMGAVYEAEDLSLRQRVALKTIRSERADDARAVDRFKREALLARRVTHRNVCRVFDVGYHAEQMFLTMELLDGETLSARVRRVGALPPAEALVLVEQMVEALAAAHRVGVVHRDFKCSNVMLAGDRTVVTDFGLAHDATADEHERSRDGFIGSPAYVAPEQVGGRQVTFAADIYALGVVMFEMVTGRLPFVGATPMATAVLRLNEDAPSARSLAPQLPEVWQATISRCLRRDPEARFARVEEVVRALKGERVTAAPRRRRRGLAITAALVAVVLAAGAAGWHWSRGAVALNPGERHTVAVLDLEDGGGRPDEAWRASAFADLLSAQLAGGDLHTLPRELVAGRPLGTSTKPESLALLRENGAQLAIAGSYRQSGDTLTFHVRLVDTRTARTLRELEEAGPPSALFELAARTAGKLRRSLGLPELSPAEASRTRGALPANPKAAQLYTDGLTALRRFQPAAAQRAFQEAVAIDPDQPMIYAALASAWHELESEQREREAAQQAFDRSANLPREERLSIEAAYREALKDWSGAAQIRLTLATFFPDNLEYGLKLAEAQRRAGRTDDALATLARLRRLPMPDGNDPRIDLAEANARVRKDASGALAAVKQAIERGTQRGAVGVVAQARVVECGAESAAMHVDAAEAACRAAIKLFTDEGNRAGVARAMVAMATLYITARRSDEARAYERDAEKIYREIGSSVGVVHAQAVIAIAYKRAGDLATAEKILREAIGFYRTADEPQLMIKALDDLASTLTSEGRNEEALPYYRQVIETAHAHGLSGIEANAMSNLSITLTRRGELDEARRFADGAVALWRKLGQPNDTVFGLDSVEQIALRQGRLADAQKADEEALATRESLGWSGGPSRQNLAELAMVQGNVERAEALGRKAVEEFHTEGERVSEMYALDVLTRVLMRAGRLPDAEVSLARASELAKQTGAHSVSIAGARALVKAAQGDAATAVSELRATIAENDRAGYVDDVLDQRQVLAEVLVQHGPRAEAQRAVTTLKREAAAHGYVLAVRDAAALERKLR